MAHQVGQALCYYILQENGQVMVQTSIQKMTMDEKNNQEIQSDIKAYDETLTGRIGNSDLISQVQPHPASLPMIDIDDDAYEPFEPEAEMPKADEDDPETYEKFISTQAMLEKGEIFAKGQVISHKHDSDGVTRGKANRNPVLYL